jgi:hypothetical protein
MSKGSFLPSIPLPSLSQFLSWSQSRLSSIPKPRLPLLAKFQLPPLNPLATQTASARMRSLTISALVPGIKANWEWPACTLFMTIQAFTTNYFGKSWFGTLGRALFPFVGMGLTAAVTWKKSILPELDQPKYVEQYRREQCIQSQRLEDVGKADEAMGNAFDSVRDKFTNDQCCIDPSSAERRQPPQSFEAPHRPEASKAVYLHIDDFSLDSLSQREEPSTAGPRINENSLKARYAERLQQYAAKCNEFNQLLAQEPEVRLETRMDTLENTVARLTQQQERHQGPEPRRGGSHNSGRSSAVTMHTQPHFMQGVVRTRSVDPHERKKEDLANEILAIKTELVYLRFVLVDPTKCFTCGQVSLFLLSGDHMNELRRDSVSNLANMLTRQAPESFTAQSRTLLESFRS